MTKLLFMVSLLLAPNEIWTNDMTDQQKCQAEADYMAKNRMFCHVGPCIGRFEGIGWSQSNCIPQTCTPKYKMNLTGDAISMTNDGIIIRVRSWR